MNERGAQKSVQIPLNMVGSSVFGRYPKISVEQTFNQFIAEDFLVNFAGYQFNVPLLGNGRGFFSSPKANLMFAASENKIFKITSGLSPTQIDSMATNSGDVFIDEDILGNVAFCDGDNIHIDNYLTGNKYIAGIDVDVATKVITPLDFVPNYVFFHNGRFIATSGESGGAQVGQWRLSTTKVADDGTVFIVFPTGTQFQGGFQTKPDLPIAGVRFPGRENNILIMGSIVSEIWNDQGLTLFPYQRNSSFNLDFGCLNAATIATLENLIVWLGSNERSGPVIMYTTGQDIQKISTDGIDAKFENLKFPEVSYGFMYRQAGHVFYVITFYAPEDNVTYTYDFNTGKFYTLTDENLNYYIAKRTVFFNKKYYFISINDGNIYEIDSDFTTYEYMNNDIKEIPRHRVTKTYRTPNNTPGVLQDLSFVVEQGIDTEYTGQGNNIASIDVLTGGTGYTTCQVLIEGDGLNAQATATITSGVITGITVNDVGIGYTWMVVTLIGDGTGATAQSTLNVANYVPRVDLSVSYDGGYTWSSFDQMQLQTYGKFKNRFYYNNLGFGNEFTLQFRIWCKSRFICSDGVMTFYQ